MLEALRQEWFVEKSLPNILCEYLPINNRQKLIPKAMKNAFVSAYMKGFKVGNKQFDFYQGGKYNTP